MSRVFDYRTKHHKAKFVIFWESQFFSNLFVVEIYSSLGAALKSLDSSSVIWQVVHDASGKLVAYSKNGKVVIL